ncbi:MAG: hypothetical protein AB1586_16675 [Pseudomonadota bacterium]
MNGFVRITMWAAIISIPLSWIVLANVYMFVHGGGLIILILLAPGFFILDRSGTLPSPPLALLMLYYLVQFGYYAAILAFFRWRIEAREK